MINKKALLFFLLSLFFVSIVSAGGFGVDSSIGFGKKDSCIPIYQTCSNCSYNNITSIVLPNKSVDLLEVSMTKQGTYYNYTYCSANTSGEYFVNGRGDLNGVIGVWDYNFYINPQGIIATEERTQSTTRAIYFLFGIGLLLFVGFLFVKESKPIKWTFFICAVIFLVAALNIISITLTDEVVNPNLESFFDSFTAIAFIFYWFAFGLLILMWIFTFFNTYFYKKNMRNAQRYGSNEGFDFGGLR